MTMTPQIFVFNCILLNYLNYMLMLVRTKKKLFLKTLH